MERQQTQTPARRTVSKRRTRHTIQRQTESMDIDPGFSNTQPNNPSIPALHKPTATQHHNLPKGRRGIPSTSVELTENPTASLPNSPEPLQPGEMWQPKYGIISITIRLFLAMSRPVTQFSSMTIKSRRC